MIHETEKIEFIGSLPAIQSAILLDGLGELLKTNMIKKCMNQSNFITI